MADIGLSLAIAGVVLSGPPIVNTLIKLGEFIVDKAKAHRQIDDNRKLCDQVISLNQSQSQLLLAFVHKFDKQISQELRDEVYRLYQSLRNIYEDLIPAFAVTDTSSSSGTVKQPKLSSRDIIKIQSGIQNLETWNDRFLKLAIVILFFGPNELMAAKEGHERAVHTYKALDRIHKLREAVQSTLANTVPPTKLLLDSDDNTLRRTPLPDSELYLVNQPSGSMPELKPSLVEDRPYSDDTDTVAMNKIRRTVRDIASILHEADPGIMGVLRCQGFRQEKKQNRFELHFMLPDSGQNPRSLRNLLRDPTYRDVGPVHPLNHRLDLAKRLASAVFFIHSADFVHKNIRPENIIIFESRLSDTHPDTVKYHQFPRALGVPYLVGYDGIRKVDTVSDRARVDHPERGIYLSPERHRLKIGDEFTMQHDVYSLGVVLFEIAIWKDLTSHASSIGKMLWHDQGAPKHYTIVRDNLIKLAKTYIPRYLGQKYTDAVVTCLTSLEQDWQTGGLEDQDGVIVGLAYVTQVLKRLEEIVL